jgi:hypothetical protein
MGEQPAVAAEWASARRRRWSASRMVAALALHLLVLTSLKLAIDRVEVQRRSADRSTTLVTVALHAALPPPPHPLPAPRTGAHANATTARDVQTPAPPRPRAAAAAQAITLPVPSHDPPPVAAATPPASSPKPDLSFLDNAATRQAIRDVARGDTLASAGNAATHEDNGSELLATDGSHAGTTRNLPPPPPAQLLARNIAAAHKGDCGKGEYLGGGMGLLSAPFLIAAEAMGQCSAK